MLTRVVFQFLKILPLVFGRVAIRPARGAVTRLTLRILPVEPANSFFVVETVVLFELRKIECWLAPGVERVQSYCHDRILFP